MRAIVTGASSGLGQAIYNHLKKGYNDACGGSQSAVVHDVEGVSRRGPDTFVDFATEEAGYFARCKPCDLLVLNHGILSFNEIKDQEQLVAVNLTSYFQALHMQAIERQYVREGGSIILIASVAGITGAEDVPLYAALKAGVVSLARSFAKPLAKQGVRINSISPGFFKTSLVAGDTPRNLIEKVPLRREAQVDEILPAIDFLVASKYTTGSNVVCDGGVQLNG